MQLLPAGKVLVPTTANHLGRPKFVQAGNDVVPLWCTWLQTVSNALPSASDVQVLCTPVVVPVWIVWLVMRLIFCFVSCNFSADGGGAAF